MYSLVIMFFLNNGDVDKLHLSKDVSYDTTIVKSNMSKESCLKLSSQLMENLQGSNYELKCIPTKDE